MVLGEKSGDSLARFNRAACLSHLLTLRGSNVIEERAWGGVACEWDEHRGGVIASTREEKLRWRRPHGDASASGGRKHTSSGHGLPGDPHAGPARARLCQLDA